MPTSVTCAPVTCTSSWLKALTGNRQAAKKEVIHLQLLAVHHGNFAPPIDLFMINGFLSFANVILGGKHKPHHCTLSRKNSCWPDGGTMKTV